MSTTASQPTSVTEKNKFVFTENLEKALNLAFNSEENIILFGKGGFAKSEFSNAFFNNLSITPFVQTMGSGTTTDRLFGGIDIKTFNESGKIEYLVENSFMNHEYVIFEELFDAPDYILEQLKDILTAKQFRNGGQVFPIKTKLIVCCTNKTREEFSKNDSLKALMERFPLEVKVEWETYNRDTYNHLFRTVLGKEFNELAYLIEKLAINGVIVSPRTAIKAAKIVNLCGHYDCLDFIAEFSGKNQALIRQEMTKYKNVKVIDELLSEIDEKVISISSIPLDSLENIKIVKNTVRMLDVLVKKLNTKKADDELLTRIQEKTKMITNYINNKNTEIENATT